MVSLQAAAAGITGTLAMHSSSTTTTTPSAAAASSSLAHLQQQLDIPLSSQASRLFSLKQSFQCTVVDNGSRNGGSRRRGLARCALVLQERELDRELLEDTVSIVVDPKGVEPSFFGVFDGHGGSEVAE